MSYRFSAIIVSILISMIPTAFQAAEPRDIPEVPGPSGTGARGIYESIRSGESGLVREDLPLRLEIAEPKERETTREPTKETNKDRIKESRKPNTKALDLNGDPWPGAKIPQIKEPRVKRQSNKGVSVRSKNVTKPTTVAAATQPATKSRDVIKPVISVASEAAVKPAVKSEPKPKIASPGITGLPQRLDPTPKGNYKYRTPDFYRGIYLNNAVPRRVDLYPSLLERARSAGVNTLVVDVQPVMPPVEFIRKARESGFYLVARVVVFEGGLKGFPPPMAHIAAVVDIGVKAAQNGFMEIQLDYIRFADNLAQAGLTLDKRYRVISGILKTATNRIRPLGVRLGGDIFGRIAFNRDDIIGQKLEVFAEHLDTIYPMLYPSHFYGEPYRIGDPYNTVLDGARNCVERVGKEARIVAYIQGFDMAVKPSGLSYVEYIRRQIQATEKAGGSGFVVWNALSDYNAFFQALAKQDVKSRASSVSTAR